MPKMPKSQWIAAIAVVTALLALPTAAQATLVFTRAPLNPSVYAANDNGSGIHKIAKGSQPDVSPDGKTVAYFHEGPGHAQELLVAATDGSGSPRTLLAVWRESFIFAWSADSSTVAAVTGPELGKKRLVAIDAASGGQQTIAKGYFSGVSFDPAGWQLVYSKAVSEKYPPRSDVFVASLTTGKSTSLTKTIVRANRSGGRTERLSSPSCWAPSIVNTARRTSST